MDARHIGAAKPGDSRMFKAFTADLNIDATLAAIEQAITAEQQPTVQPPLDAPAPNPDDRERRAPIQKPPEPTNPPANQPLSTLPEIDAPPELVVPPKPEPTTSKLVNWWANAFPNLVWLSVISGLVGQIYGWTQTFGGGPIALAVAAALGGTFEFIMVAASSRGLRDIGRARSPWQSAAFLLAGTACAGMAFWMNLHHFTGTLQLAGIAAAAATAIGYLAHVAVHFFDELDNRSRLRAWEAERDRVEAEIRARDERSRADHETYQAELRKARTAELKALTRNAAAPADGGQPAKTEAVRSSSATGKKKPGWQVTKEEAVRIGVEKRVHTPATLKAALTEAGYTTLPKSPTTVENWCKQIKVELGETN